MEPKELYEKAKRKLELFTEELEAGKYGREKDFRFEDFWDDLEAAFQAE